MSELASNKVIREDFTSNFKFYADNIGIGIAGFQDQFKFESAEPAHKLGAAHIGFIHLKIMNFYINFGSVWCTGSMDSILIKKIILNKEIKIKLTFDKLVKL